jgi:hypothetical protein
MGILSPAAKRPSANGHSILLILLILSELLLCGTDSILKRLILDPREISAKKISQGRQDLRDLGDLFFAYGETPFRPKAVYPDNPVDPV